MNTRLQTGDINVMRRPRTTLFQQIAPVTNGRVLFNAIPKDYPEPGKTVVYDTSLTINLDDVPLSGGFLLKTLCLSIDPYLHLRMGNVGTITSTSTYAASEFKIGEPLVSYGVGVVIRSECPGVNRGEHIYGLLEHEQYSICPSLHGFSKIENKYNLPWSVFIGAAGMPGRTAFGGWREYSQAKEGDTAFVSGGSGQVGSLVIQLAKLDGLKVIASAGSDEKVQFLKDIGADVAFNYKTEDTPEVLKREGPINIYWDNVGGETLEAALDAGAPFARYLECGMISGYNVGGLPIRNMWQVVTKSLVMMGVAVYRFEQRWEKDFQEFVISRLATGELKYHEDVTKGLNKVGDVIYAVQKGLAKGKAVVQVADE